MSEKDQEIASLKAQIARLEAERNALAAKKNELEEALASLQAQNAWLRRKVFGSSMSEKHLPTPRPSRSKLTSVKYASLSSPATFP